MKIVYGMKWYQLLIIFIYNEISSDIIINHYDIHFEFFLCFQLYLWGRCQGWNVLHISNGDAHETAVYEKAVQEAPFVETHVDLLTCLFLLQFNWPDLTQSPRITVVISCWRSSNRSYEETTSYIWMSRHFWKIIRRGFAKKTYNRLGARHAVSCPLDFVLVCLPKSHRPNRKQRNRALSSCAQPSVVAVAAGLKARLQEQEFGRNS